MKRPHYFFSSPSLRKQRGSSLLELMLVIAITATLASLGLPAYKNYWRRAALLELLQLVMPHKLERELSLLENPQGKGTNGVKQEPSTELAQQHPFRHGTLEVCTNGNLKIDGLQQLEGLKLVLTPKLKEGQVGWQSDYSGCRADLLKLAQQTFRFADL